MAYLNRLAFLAALLLSALGAQAQEWSDWVSISAGQSYLHLSTPLSGLSTDEISREESRERQTEGRQEFWAWGSGAMHMYVLGGKYYIPRQGRSDLLGSIAQWETLKELGLEATTRNVERGNNRLGNYYYVEISALNADLHCFVFLQNLWPIVDPGYESPSGAVASGVLTGFDCQNEEDIPFAEHADLMKSYIKGLRRQ